MVDRLNLTPIKTSNLTAVYGFGYYADFKLHLEHSSKKFGEYIKEIKIFFLKNKLTNWNIFYDKTQHGRVLIYHRKLIMNANNIIYNLRASGDSFANRIPNKSIFTEAESIRKSLKESYKGLFFLEQKPKMCIFPYFNYKSQ